MGLLEFADSDAGGGEGGAGGRWRDNGSRLLRPEEIALHEGVDEGAHAVVFLPGGGDDRLDGGAVGEPDGGTGGEDGELAREIAGEQGVLGA